MRVGDTVRHTGDRPDGTFAADQIEQTRQTFRNLTITLTEAGATWSDVVEINSFRVDLASWANELLGVAAEFVRVPYPAWTDAGVTELFEPEALVEISCVAVLVERAP